jgi:hypothetical protein
VIFTCVTNLKCLSDQIKEFFIDGTFKCCPKFFLQLYIIHGCEHGNYVPLVFVLLPSKTEIYYNQMCRERDLVFSPETVHIDIEMAMHNSVRRNFKQANTSCCRFHLGQSMWRKIQTIGFSAQYPCMIYNWRKNLGQHLNVPSIKISLIWSERHFRFVTHVKITMPVSLEFLAKKRSSLFVFKSRISRASCTYPLFLGNFGRSLRRSRYSDCARFPY